MAFSKSGRKTQIRPLPWPRRFSTAFGGITAFDGAVCRAATRYGRDGTRSATCKPNNVDPVAYISKTLQAILDGRPQSPIDELMPWSFVTASSLAHR